MGFEPAADENYGKDQVCGGCGRPLFLYHNDYTNSKEFSTKSNHTLRDRMIYQRMTHRNAGQFQNESDMDCQQHSETNQDAMDTEINDVNTNDKRLSLSLNNITLSHEENTNITESLCANGTDIPDKEVIVLAGVGLWHSVCAKCHDCEVPLRRHCFNHPETPHLLYCHLHFFRRYGARCSSCSSAIFPSELARRAHDFLFHKECFTCVFCDVTIVTGQLFYLSNDGQLICTTDFQKLKDGSSSNRRDCNSPEPTSSSNIIHYPPSTEDLAHDVISHMSSHACAYSQQAQVTCSCEPETMPSYLQSSANCSNY